MGPIARHKFYQTEGFDYAINCRPIKNIHVSYKDFEYVETKT